MYKDENLPEVTDLRSGRSRKVVTLLLSSERSTEGSGGGGAGVSEWERSCIARVGIMLPERKGKIRGVSRARGDARKNVGIVYQILRRSNPRMPLEKTNPPSTSTHLQKLIVYAHMGSD